MRIAERAWVTDRGTRWALIALLCWAFPATLLPQTRQNTKQGEDIDALLQERAQSALPQSPSPTGIALESIVNPDFYHVGPSDVLAVNIWMSPPLNFALTVTPEGTLIIPSVGEVNVANLTLSEAKKLIVQEVRRRYVVPEVSATLLKPRAIVVSIMGNVLNPGLFTLNAVDRANRLIEEANKLSKLQSPQDLAPIKKSMSTRNILLRHKDGSEERVDLAKYLALHHDAYNPYLREGDVVVVPRRDPERNVFGVYGQVNTPGRYEYVEGDRVLDALRIANGLTLTSLPEQALFSRSTADGSGLTTTVLNITALLAGTVENFPIEPGDRIVVQGKVELREDYNVDVKGEVRYPSTYPITKDRTRLSEIIRRAGGVTENADLRGATVIRRTIREEAVDAEVLASQRGIIATQDTIGYAVENSLRITREMVTVDLARLVEQGDSTQDILLHGEDEIVIPKRQYTVFIFGQVASPGHVPFIDGKDAEYYVRLAGGFSERASRGDVKVVKAKTKQWLDPSQTSIEAGDLLWIPAEPDHPFSYYMTVASQAATVLSVIIGIGVLVSQLSN